MPAFSAPWLRVRKELTHSRAVLLTALSFLLPLAIWCIAAYGPWWKVAHEVTLAAESPRLESIYTAGNRLDPATWHAFFGAIQRDNDDIQKARAAGQAVPATTRQNKKILRQIYAPAVANGWLTKEQETDDEAIRALWLKLGSGALKPPPGVLSSDNLKIIAANAALLKKTGEDWPEESLLKLLPQSTEQVARPAYLVPPDVVAKSFWQGITADKPLSAEAGEGAGRKTLLMRYGESWRTIVAGFLLAVLVAVPLGILAGTFDAFSRLIEPFSNFFSYMPAPAFGVVLMAIFGLDFGPKIMLVFLGTVFCGILMVAKTTRRLDESLLEAAQTLGANQRQLLLKVVVPGILPNLYNDLRLLFATAWTWLVIAELLGFKSGLAEVIDTHGRRFQFDIVYPAILLIGLSGFFMDQMLGWLARFLFPWMEDGKPGLASRMLTLVCHLPRKIFPVKNPAVLEPTPPVP